MVMDKTSIDDIESAFDDLIYKNKSREEIANWALKLQFSGSPKHVVI